MNTITTRRRFIVLVEDQGGVTDRRTGKRYRSIDDAVPASWDIVLEAEDLDSPRTSTPTGARRRDRNTPHVVTYPRLWVAASKGTAIHRGHGAPVGSVPVSRHYELWVLPRKGEQ